MSAEKQTVNVETAKTEILNAMLRGLNVTANAGHIRDLAESYALLAGGLPQAQSTGLPKRAASPIVK